MRALTLMEVMIGASLLAVVMLALISGSASTQRTAIEAREIVLCRNFAHDTMEQLLLADWTTLRAYAVNTLNGQVIDLDVPGLPGKPQGSRYCRVQVREPTMQEAPFYNLASITGVTEYDPSPANNPKRRRWRGPNGAPLGPIPGTPLKIPNAPPATGPSPTVEAPGAGGPTMFTIIVEVTLPNMPGIKGGTRVRLQALRSSL